MSEPVWNGRAHGSMVEMTITYSLEPDLSADEFRAVLIASTLGQRRPVNDRPRLDRMLREADVIVTARHKRQLVGIARAITDFSYCCYLCELAVDVAYQRQGIGKRLIAETHAVAGELTTLLLVAAPGAESYYPRIGMQPRASCWRLPRKR